MPMALIGGSAPGRGSRHGSSSSETPTSGRAASASALASDIEDEASGAGAGDADHHAVVGLPRRPRRAPSRGGPGSPSSTGVSQVPQVPSPHEDSTPTPASSIAARMDLSGGTSGSVRFARGRPRTLRCSTGSVSGLGHEALHVQRALRPRAQRCSTAPAAARVRSSRPWCRVAAARAARPDRAVRVSSCGQTVTRSP